MAARMMPSVLVLLLMPTGVWATLPDPTAPPAAVSQDAAASAPAVSLTAIKRSGKHRVAVIGGQEIGVGGRYEDARVVRITENEVVLRRGDETTVLTLYPHIEKRLRGR